jgi:hypothetical protein
MKILNFPGVLRNINHVFKGPWQVEMKSVQSRKIQWDHYHGHSADFEQIALLFMSFMIMKFINS